MRLGDKVNSLLSITGRPGAWHKAGRVVDLCPAGALLGPCLRNGSTMLLGAWGTLALVRWPDGSEAWQSTAFLALA